MGIQKLDPELEQVEIKQTSTTIKPIRFRDEVINKIKKDNFIFGKKRDFFIPFIVSKDSHQKGLKLRVYKGSVKDKSTRKVFYIQYWFNGKSAKLKLGDYTQRFGVKECDDYLIELHKTHTDSKTGYWLKDPSITKKDEQRLVE